MLCRRSQLLRWSHGVAIRNALRRRQTQNDHHGPRTELVRNLHEKKIQTRVTNLPRFFAERAPYHEGPDRLGLLRQELAVYEILD